jgi:hypothetical protein
MVPTAEDDAVPEHDSRVYVRSYKAAGDDVFWAQCGVVATVAKGEAFSVLRRRIMDAGFQALEFYPLGGDRILVRSAEGSDVMTILGNAKDFFSLCFSNWVRWEKAVIPYQRGAWVRIYGIPLHAWNENFFKLCTLDCGRFLRPDSLTVTKEKLDFARVLLATSALEVIKRVEKLLVDGTLVEVQIIEEWGYDLGDDACYDEDDTASRASLTGNGEYQCDPEASNQVDMLVDKLAEGLVDREVVEEDCHLKHGVGVTENQVACVPVLEQVQGIASPASVVGGSDSSGSSGFRVAETLESLQGTGMPDQVVLGTSAKVHRFCVSTQGAGRPDTSQAKHTRTLSCPPGGRGLGRKGPWSLEWLQDRALGDAGVIFSATKRVKNGSAEGNTQIRDARPGQTKKRAGGLLRHSIYSLKRVARLPTKEREEVMRILRKNERRRKKRRLANQPGTTGSQRSSKGVTTSSSVGNDWKNWVVLQGNDDVVADDVTEVGKSIGVTFKGDKANMFSVLSKSGADKLVSSCSRQGAPALGEAGC